ncbi:MAG TPA: putative Ig domain-containing protein, partial [Blastocatellia bacterium]|nr:putative Ig domain-containing protein [Blastocatellia bacterium]
MFRALSLLCVVLFLLCTSSALAHSHAGDHASRSPVEWMNGYTMVLVDADSREELLAARDFIVAQGGTVSVILPPHTIFGWITPEVGARIVGRQKIRSLHRSPVEASGTGFRDRETLSAINSFNEVASGQGARRTLREIESQVANPSSRPPMPDCALPKPPVDREDFMRSLRSMSGAQGTSMLQSTVVTPQFWNNSDVMDGTVAVAAFLMESNGGIDTNVFNWSQADQDLAIAQIIQGLNWWVDQSRAFSLSRPLQFTLVPFLPNNPAAQVPYEPSLREGRNANLWINHIMRNLGGTSTDAFVNVASFNRVIREQNRTDWAFSIFMAYNPAPAQTSFADGRASWAYIGGPHTNMLFRSYGWAINQIVSHEIGHIFFACDEYSQPGFQSCSCSCAPEIRPDAKNGNCEDLSCNARATACIMRLNEPALCPFTVAQIGWATSVPKPLPSAPVSLVATPASPTVVNLIWQDTSRDTPGSADGFQVERRGGSSAEFAQIGVVSAASSPGFSDSTVLPNTAYAYRVRAFNLTGSSAFSGEASVITPITPSSLSVSTTEMPDATVEVSYSRALTAVGGAGGYAWVIETGSLPPGLTLSQTGTVSGIATTAGAYNFVARVSDSDNNRATKALSLLVKPAAPLTITTRQLPIASVGTTYSQTLGASGGQTPYTWSIQSGTLPEGLVLNQSGTISGIPDRAGSSSFVLKITDATGASQSATISMVVNPVSVQLSISTDSLSDGVVGQNYSQTLGAVGGNSPYTWELTSGALPAGVALSDSGVISGRPLAPGEFDFEVQVRDQSGQSIRKSLSIDVDPASQLTILNQTLLPPAAVGVPYSVELKAISGNAPYTWSKKKKAKFGAFPAGITLSSQGILSGTPTTQGMANFTITVRDSASKGATKPLTIEVGPPPAPLAVRTETLPNATQSMPYTTALQSDGGVGPYTWVLEAGALPDGLTLAPDGAIAGRATTIGSVSFIVRLRDSLGTTTTKSLFIVVVPPPPPLVIQTLSLPETFAERPYSQTLHASGGLPPYSWSLVSGNIGSGLNLSVDGVISGTPLVPGLSVFVIRVTDSAQ